MVGATGDVGTALVGRLAVAGHQVRSISRQAGISLDDEAALGQAFKGVDGAYLMIPFDLQAKDLHARERDFGAKLARAVKNGGVRRVVLLSGLNAHLRKGSSLGAALMEDRLNELDIDEVAYLRAGFFMENFLRGMNFAAQAQTGIFRTPFRGDLPIPMVSAGDVAHKAADLLTATAAFPVGIQELHGGGDYSLAQATQILGATLGRHDVQYEQVPYQDAIGGMIAAGISPSVVQAVLETAKSFNAEETWALQPRSELTTTSTTLEKWATELLLSGRLR